MEDYRLEQTGQEVQDILNGAAMNTDLVAETERAEGAEGTLQDNIDAEARAREEADGLLQQGITDEELRAKAAEEQAEAKIVAIEGKIPSGASSENKLATEEYVDDSVSTNTATYRGNYNLVSDLHLGVDATHEQIAFMLSGTIATADNNDYCFVQVPTSAETPTEIRVIERYKFNGEVWGFEYALNNSGYTAAQWAAINSGITSALVTKLGALPTAADLAAALLGKQDVLTFDSAPTQGSNNPAKSGGIWQMIDDEKGARINRDAELQAAIEAILVLIPSAATALNQLADKAFVNSSVATETATFRGTYNLVSDLHLSLDATHDQIAAALGNAISTADNNDYAFVQIPTSVDTPTEIRITERYKFNGTAWAYEYDLNNSGFTAAQWAAINSGITALLVSKLSELPTATELATALAGKQAVLTFDNAPTQDSDNPVKSGGIYTAIKNETDARELSEQGLQQGISTNAGDISDIKDVLPSGATALNQLVDNDSMVAYVTTLISGISATFNVTSADGHITLHITQVDGEITSVTLTTSDIASAAALNLKASQADLEALTSVVNTKASQSDLTTLAGRVSVNETDISNLQAAYAGLTQSDIIVGALPASGVADTIYRVPGTTSYSDYMWNGSTFVLMATYNNAIKSRVLVNDNNIVSSQGILNELYWDVIHAGYINNSGQIVQPSAGIGTNRCILIPVAEDDIIDIVVDENSSYIMVAFVSSWPSNESPGNSATIVGGRKEFNHNGRIKAPNGAIYLWASLYVETDSFNRGAKKIFKNNKLAFCWFNRCDYSQNQLVDSFINNDYAQFIEGYMGTDGKWVPGNDDISIVVPVCEGDVITFDVDRNASDGYCMTAFFKQTAFNEFPSTDTITISDRTEYNGAATVTIPSDVYYMWFSCYKVSDNFLRGPQYIKKNGIVVYDKISIPNETIFMPSLTTLYTCRQGQVGGCPENSLVGFRTAYQYGYRRVRVSIEFTSDNVPVGFHDATLATTGIVYDSNGNVVTDNSLTINGMTYAELLDYDFGLYAGSEYRGTKIMKIEDFLIQCKKYGQYAVLEVKDYPAMTQEQARILFSLVRAASMERHVKYSTYTNTSLGYILALDPHATIGFIGYYSSSVKATLLGLLSAADEVFYDMYENDIDNVPSEDYNEFRAAGLKFKSGTGTNETQARNLYRFDEVECMTMKCLELVEL